MSTSSATLELVMRARNLASGAVNEVGDSLTGLGRKAGETAGRIGGAFASLGGSLAVGLGSAVDSLSTGGNLGDAMLTLGGFMAGELTENFAGSLLEKLASGGILAAITAPLAGLGTAAGGLISAAIPIGMAALPFLIIGAIVAVIAVLIANEEIRNKVIGFASGLVSNLVNALSGFLGQLPAVLGAAFGAAFDFVVKGVIPFVGQLVELWLTLPLRLAGLGLSILETIIGGLVGLPGRVADIVRDAFANLKIDIGPFHITGAGVTVDLPKIDVPHFATGVVGFSGGLAVVGERGPELLRLPRGSDIIPNGRAAIAPQPARGVLLEGISEASLIDAMERGLYFRLRRAGQAGR